MKIHELLEAADNSFAAIKELNLEFKTLASDLDLTLVAGMGWPNITQKGGWFGGGLGQKGGKSKKLDTLELPIENRRKALLTQLAKKLEALIDDGRDIAIGRGATRSNHTEPGIKGQVYNQLVKNMIIDNPPGNCKSFPMPCLVWFVSQPKHLEGKDLFCVIAHLAGPPAQDKAHGGKYLRINVGSMLDREQSKQIKAAFNKFKKANDRSFTQVDNRNVERPANSRWHDFVAELAAVASKIMGEPLPPGFTGMDSGVVYLESKIMHKNAVRLTPEQLEQVVAVFRKHCK